MPRKKKEVLEKQNIHRDHIGKYTTPEKAIPAKQFRAFLGEMRAKHGNVPIDYILAHYDQAMNEKPANSNIGSGSAPVTPDMGATTTVSDALDMMFKSDDQEYDVFALLRFDDYDNFAALHRAQELLKEKLPYPWIEWEDLSDMHVTLAYFMDASAMEAAIIADHIQEVTPIDTVTLDTGSVFTPTESNGKYVLVLNVTRTPELDAMQQKIYELGTALVLEVSDYSNPDAWKPHITLAYSEEPVDEKVMNDLGGFTLQVSRIDVSTDMNVIGSSPNGDEMEEPEEEGQVYSKDAEEVYENPQNDFLPENQISAD